MIIVIVVLSIFLVVSVLANIGLSIFLATRRRPKDPNQYEVINAMNGSSGRAPPPNDVSNGRPKPKTTGGAGSQSKKSEPIKDIGGGAQRSEKEIATTHRSDRHKLMEPVSKVEFARFMSLVVTFINDHFDDSHKQSVLPDNETNSKKLQVGPPDNAENVKRIIEDLKHFVVPNMCHMQHPRYHARYSGRSLADVLATTISTSLAFDTISSPIVDVIERILCEWFSQIVSITKLRYTFTDTVKDPVGTVFYNAVDTFSCLIQHAVQIRGDASTSAINSMSNAPRHTFVVYCGDDAHCDLEKACHLMKVKLRRVNTKRDDRFAVTGSVLEKQVEKDVERGMIPIMMVANFGSVNIATNDDVSSIIPVVKRRRIWLHLDADYAGCEWFNATERGPIHSLLCEINSMHMCFSRLLPFSGDLWIAWSSEKLLLDTPFSRNSPSGESAIRLWILLRLYGMKSIKDGVRRKVMLGNQFASRLLSHPEFFLVHHENSHGVVLFQYNNTSILNRSIDVNKLTSMFYYFITESSQMKFALVRFQSKVMIRACINYERCNASNMEESVSTLLNIVDDFEEAMKKKMNNLRESTRSDFSQQIGGSPNETTEKTQEMHT